MAKQGNTPATRPSITTFAACAEAGYPIMESYPRQCAGPDGRTFTEIVDEPDTSVGTSSPVVAGGCAVGGCSGQICGEVGEADTMVTTCEYRAEYACYKTASCARQSNGKCGWSQTPELKACLAHPEPLLPTDIQVQ
jgi:eight-cysteine-cluster-containing protein